MARATASFNGVDLASSVPGLSIIATNPYRPATREINENKIANTDRSVTSSAYYKDKKLNVRCEIGRNTREEFDDSVDALNTLIQGREKTLILSYGSGTRQWNATYSNTTFTDVQGGHGILDIEFLAADPIGIDPNSVGLFTTAFTGNNINIPFNGPMLGSAEWQQPFMTFTIASLTGGTGASVVIGNPSNGQQITITRNWAAGDSIFIDSREGQQSVEVNGTEVAFDGSIPEFIAGETGSLDWSDTLTTRSVSGSGSYYKRYA